jgi:CRP-like cAMP-binding protein
MKEIKEIIKSIHPLSMDSAEQVIELIEFEEYKKGSCFIERGKRDSNEYFLLDGICRSYVLDPQGEEITISFFNSGTVLSPFVTRTVNEISNLNFQASTHIKVGIMDASKFLDLMVDHLDIRDFGNMVLKIELQNKVEKEIGHASLTAKERLMRFREQYPMFENLVPHSSIATYLGITNISLSRLRKELIT